MIDIKKENVKNSENIFSVGYCEIQTLLRYEEVFGSSKSEFGWDCNYYIIDDICICTGYRPIGVNLDYDFNKKYEKLAEDVLSSYSMSEFDKRKKGLKAVLKQYIEAIKKEYVNK